MTIRAIRCRAIGDHDVATPQCCEPIPLNKRIRNKAWAKSSYSAEHCQKASGILINNKPYCRQHAANIALEMWLVGDLEEVR